MTNDTIPTPDTIAAPDERIELAALQRLEHAHVLRLHALAHHLRQLLFRHDVGVALTERLHDAATVGEQVRDDVRMRHARVFGLDVEVAVSPTDVVVEAYGR